MLSSVFELIDIGFWGFWFFVRWGCEVFILIICFISIFKQKGVNKKYDQEFQRRKKKICRFDPYDEKLYPIPSFSRKINVHGLIETSIKKCESNKTGREFDQFHRNSIPKEDLVNKAPDFTLIRLFDRKIIHKIVLEFFCCANWGWLASVLKISIFYKHYDWFILLTKSYFHFSCEFKGLFNFKKVFKNIHLKITHFELD